MDLKRFYKNKKVLITGNTGFKGSWLTQILIWLGADVSGIALSPATNPNLYEMLSQKDLINEYITDIRDYDRMLDIFRKVRPEIVFHLAAQPIVLDSYKDPRYTYDVNVMGTVNVCECIRNIDSVRSFVNVTTDKIYKNNEWEYPYRETDVLDGFDPYSNSKSCSELVTASYNRSFFKEHGIAVSTCRAGNVIGGGDFSKYRIVPDCYRSIISGKTIEVRNPDSVRPYQHVLEALYFYLLVAMKQSQDIRFVGNYNIGPEFSDCIKTSQICDLFCKYWGESAMWQAVGISGPHEANSLRLDTSRARTVFRWKPVWNVEIAMMKTVEWYRSFFDGENIKDLTCQQINCYLDAANDMIP